MSANFSDFAEFIEGVLIEEKAMEKSKEYSDEYWQHHLKKVEWERKILMLMPDRNLLPEQIKVLKQKGCQAFNIWV